MLKFTWDEQKATVNRQKHGIAFDEARSVFFDDYARLIVDPDNSDEEDRFIILGYSLLLRLLVVSHCSVIRIISARKATRPEKNVYERYRK